MTSYTISSKFGPAAGDVARSAREWIETADAFVASPQWVGDYAAQQLERTLKWRRLEVRRS